MCSRYKFTVPLSAYGGELETRLEGGALQPRFNIAAGQNAPVVVHDLGKVCRLMRWGMMPSWVQKPSPFHTSINARADTVARKPAYAPAFQERRCLVLADAYYEWKHGPSGRHPYLVRMKDRSPFAFAGVWEPLPPNLAVNRLDWSAGMFVVITTEANTVVQDLRSRMPAILRPAHYDQWLDPECKGGLALLLLLKPYPPEEMEFYAVNNIVNGVEYDGPRCTERV